MDLDTPVRTSPSRVPRAGHSRAGTPGHVLLLLASAVVTAAATGALLMRLTAVLPSRSRLTVAGMDSALRTARVEDLVEVAALLVGVPVAAWFAVSLTAAAGCTAARAAGRQWAAGERFVARTAPAVVRRALVLTAGTGVALAGAGLPAGATATPPPVDLGWSPTVMSEPWGPASSEPTRSAPPTTAPAGDAAAGAPQRGAGGEPTTATDARQPASVPAAHATQPAAVPTAPDRSTTVPAWSADNSTAPTTPPVPQPAPPPGPQPGAQPESAPGPQRGTPPGPRPAAGAGPTPRPAAVTVLPGDTLWGIAAEHLPAGATPADVALAWPAWHAANAAVIGPDPGHIVPGQVLDPPSDVAGTGAASGARP